jgi:TM2 domain-containing membrane protein YozV
MQMSLELVDIVNDLSPNEQNLFKIQFDEVRKSGTTGFLMAFFLGGLGGHHFYLGRNGLGILYVLTCWTFLPAIAAFIEMFLMGGRVEQYNRAKAAEIVLRVKSARAGDLRPVA